MFFSPQLLIDKNSNFALIWRYMHDTRRKTKTRGELLGLDVSRACNDLLSYIPSGHLNAVELKTKMSLYLLGQLFYGIVLVHQLQVNSFEVDVKSAAKSLLRVPEPEKKAPRKRTAHEDKIIAEELLKEVEPKKKRASKQRMPSLLDLNDPSAYVQDPPLRQITTEPFVGTDANFGEPMGVHTRRSETFMEIEAELRRSVQRENEPMETDVELREPKVSVGWVSFNQSPERARGPSTPHFDVSGLAPPTKRSLYEPEEIDYEQQFPPPPPVLTTPQAPEVPIYRQSIDPNQIPISQLSQDEMFLAPLPVKTEPEIRKKKGRKHLIIDEQMVISSEEMMQQLNDYSSLIKSHEALVEEYEKARRPSVAELLNPRPLNWQVLSEDLYPLFDAVLKNVRERPLTFEEANKLGFEELRRRRFAFDLHSWHSGEPVNVEPPFEEQINTKVSAAEIVLSPLRDVDPKVAAVDRSLSIEPARRHERSTTLFEEPDFDERLAEDVNISRPPEAEQFDVLQVSRVASTPEELETTALAAGEITETDILYQQIVAQRKRVMTFREVIGPLPKQMAIRKFMTLLHLLKRECSKGDVKRNVKVRQDTPYADILIKYKELGDPE